MVPVQVWVVSEHPMAESTRVEHPRAAEPKSMTASEFQTVAEPDADLVSTTFASPRHTTQHSTKN